MQEIPEVLEMGDYVENECGGHEYLLLDGWKCLQNGFLESTRIRFLEAPCIITDQSGDSLHIVKKVLEMRRRWNALSH